MKTIDGRKAEIINAGQWYNTYTGFANKHGYLDAAYRYPSVDPRVEPKDGDDVTLLVAGQLEWETYGTLWIVEAANGDRHIIGEKGLRILSDQQATIDGLTETVANLARRLAKAETQLRVAREDIVLIEEGVSEDIRKLEAKVAELEQSSSTRESRCGKGEQSNVCGAEYIPPYKPLTRDEIVEKAKADVAELLRVGRDDDARLDGGPFAGRWFDVDFAINRKKRTVVALVHELDGFSGVPYSRKKNGPHAKGIAKCAPDDCFNVHIGKSIALRKALELEVPDEYVNTPQPTEPQIGDVVEIVGNLSCGTRHHYDIHDIGKVTRVGDELVTVTGVETKYKRKSNSDYYQLVGIPDVCTIDDSRDGRYGEVYSE